MGDASRAYARRLAGFLRVRTWWSAVGYRRPQTGEEFRTLHHAAGRCAAPSHAGAEALDRAKELKPLLWAVAITAAEAVARRLVPSRSGAWLTAYPLLAAAALSDRAPRTRPDRGSLALLIGIPLAVAGYPVGCAVLGHKSSVPPPDPLALELVAVAGVVAPVEELTWGRLVEPRLGIPITAALFAAKHVVVDGRWRRAAGLALFWIGLGLVRRRSPKLALGVHVVANASGVLLGHAKGQDSF